MTRQERLKFCRACSHHKFDANNGIICSITNSPATFEVACTIYKEDPELKHRLAMDDIRAQMIHESAGGGTRFANHLLDSIILMFTYAGLAMLLAFMAPDVLNIFAQNDPLIDLPLNILMILLYYTLFEATTGRSPAKFLTGTKVVDMDGNQPGLSTILTRSFCRLVPFDGLSFLGDTDSGWHDKWSKTRVVKA